MRLLRSRRSAGQSLTDYVLVVGVVTAVVAAMQTFVRRYAQAEVRAKTDELLAISEEDATNADLLRRGLATQRRGAEQRRPGSGFQSPDVDDAALGGDYYSKSETAVSGTTIAEEAVGDGRGKMRVTQDARTVTRRGREAYKGYRERAPELLTRPGQWFSRDGEPPLKYGASFGPDKPARGLGQQPAVEAP